MYIQTKKTNVWHCLLLLLLMLQGVTINVMADDDAATQKTILTAATYNKASAAYTEVVDGVRYYFVLDTARYANVYYPTQNDELNAYRTGVIGDSKDRNRIRVYKRTFGTPSGTYYTGNNAYGDSNLPFTIDDNQIGWSIYYATGWENTESQSNGRKKITLPDQITTTIDGKSETYPVISTRGYSITKKQLTSNPNADAQAGMYYIGNNSPDTPFDLVLNKDIYEVGGLGFLDNIYEVTFTKGDDNKINCYVIHEDAFMNSTHLTVGGLTNGLFDPNNLFAIGAQAFAGSSIRRIKINSPITFVQAGAFSGDNLEYVDLSAISSLTTYQQNSIVLLRDSKLISAYTKGKNVITSISGLFDGMPEHVLVYLPSDLTFSDDALTAFKGYGSRNFIYKDKNKGLYCNHFAVYDKPVTSNYVTTGSYDYYVPTQFYTDSASYDRQFLDGYNTTYLPYSTALPSTDIVDKVYTFSQRSTEKQPNSTKYAYVFNEETKSDGTRIDSLVANKAYLIHSTTSFSMPNRIVGSDGNIFGTTKLLRVPQTLDFNTASVTAAKNVQFIGTTEAIQNDSAVYYHGYNLEYVTVTKSDGTTENQPQWRMVQSSNTNGYFNRFRGFICDNLAESSASPAKQTVVSMIFHNANGSTTSIEGITLRDLTSGDKRIYTIDGKYVGTDFNSLPNGLYIKNGKKFLKK